MGSGLILAGFRANNPTRPEDGILTALEASTLNLWGTQLVVLSACETGKGFLQPGEGVYGLRRALVMAGAQSQLISLWQVEDNATKELMVQYYQNLLADNPLGRSEALRQTQLDFLQSEDYTHPYFWAAFIPSGDWRPLP
jgi:CHAT domain-containing protein